MSLKDTNDGEIDLNGIIVIGQLVDLLVDHETEDAHHGGTAVIELDTTLDAFDTIIKNVPTKVEKAITEISGELALAGDFDCRECAVYM